jgi:hypothetical protein
MSFLFGFCSNKVFVCAALSGISYNFFMQLLLSLEECWGLSQVNVSVSCWKKFWLVHMAKTVTILADECQG